MKPTNLTIKDLLTDDANLTFLVGAGCSVDAPSCLPAGRPMMEAMIKYTCAESEREKILKLKDLRFEQLVEIIRDRLDPELKIIDYYGQCDRPNLQHFFLAGMIKKGRFVMTTNFDFLIEYALLQSGVPKDEIIPIITKQDFETYSTPDELVNEGKKPIYKIHGSTKNVITKKRTKDSLVATIQAFGSNKEGLNVFQVEPFKRPLFEKISDGRSLVVMGYSGSDDFDIVPTLKVLKNVKKIIWIKYIFNDGRKEMIYEIEANSKSINNLDKIDHILIEIKRMNSTMQVYRVDSNTTRIIKNIIDFEPKISPDKFMTTPIKWLEDHIKSPNKIDKLYLSLLIYFDFDYYNDALRCGKEILLLCEKSQDQILKAKTLIKVGQIFKEQGNYFEALNQFKEALNLYNQLEDLLGKSTALNNIGVVYKEQYNYSEALKCFKQSLQIASKSGMLLRMNSCFNNIGIIYKEQEKYTKALEQYEQALKIADQLGDLSRKATCLSNIGNIYHVQGNYPAALNQFEVALQIDEELYNLSGCAIRLNNIGNIYYDQGDYPKALKIYENALNIIEKLGNLSEKVSCLTNIGTIYEKQNLYPKALKIYEEALEIAYYLGDLSKQASILNNLGLIYHKEGNYIKALEQYEKTLQIAKELNNLEWIRICLNNVGMIYNKQGKHDEALQKFREIMQIDEQLGDLLGKATVLNNIGGLLEDRGELNEALKHYREALAILKQLGSPDAEIIKENIAVLKNKMKK